MIRTRRLKPIYHCDAKLLALGTFASPNAKDVSIFHVLPNTKPKSCVLPDAKPKRKPVEYRLRWDVGHVHFTFFGVNFIHVGSRFPMEYGLKVPLCT